VVKSPLSAVQQTGRPMAGFWSDATRPPLSSGRPMLPPPARPGRQVTLQRQRRHTRRRGHPVLRNADAARRSLTTRRQSRDSWSGAIGVCRGRAERAATLVGGRDPVST
jgi:hypothetical protein